MEISAEKTRLMTNSANGILSILREIKVKWQNLGTIQASSTLEQLFHMMAPNQRFSQGFKAEANLEQYKHISWIKGETDVLPCHSYTCISICL